jgi:hypothetical protein
MGRPSDYTQEIADEICERLSKGETLASICRMDRMPAVRTVSDWKAGHKDFSANFARAREEGFDAIADECLAIADETSHDDKMTELGSVVANNEWISRSKLRVETRLKLLAKWDPRRYGEKLDISAEIKGDVKVTIGGDA